MLPPTILPSPRTLILLEASKSMWKSADLVQTRTEETSEEEAGCGGVETTTAAPEIAREEVVGVAPIK